MFKKYFLTILITFLSVIIVPFSVVAQHKTFKGKVIEVKDGDSVVISQEPGENLFVCRLYGIDAPELSKKENQSQPYGEKSLKELRELILGYEVEIILIHAKNNKGICIIKKNGLDINLEMVKRGLAWAYERRRKISYTSEYSDYIEAENEARTNHIGLWEQPNPEPPWEFLKKTRKR